MFRKIIILAALVLLLGAAAGLIAQEKRDDPARSAGPPDRQFGAQNQLPMRVCPFCQCPYCQKIRQNRIQRFRERRRGDFEGMNSPFAAPGGPRDRFGRPGVSGEFRYQAEPRQRLPILNEWFEQLKQAYRENDREKMGQLLRKMEQFRNRTRQALPPQGPEEIRPLPERQRDLDMTPQGREFERPAVPPQQQRRFRQRGPQQDFEVPEIGPGQGPREQENMPAAPERFRQRRYWQGDQPSLDDRPLQEQQRPPSRNLPNPERSDFPWY